MMNQAAGTNSIATVDPNLLEKHQFVNPTEAQTPSYYTPSAASQSVPWTLHRPDNYSTENGAYSNSSYHIDQRTEPHESITSTSNPTASNIPQEYNSGHTSYTSTDPYGYSNNTNYSSYYNGYQQQQSNNQTYPQTVGSYQSTGAPHQPLSSFPNTGSYAGPTSYSTPTYYNPADYQTTGGGGYQTGGSNGGYTDQNNPWQTQYPSYNNPSHQYPNYAQESSVNYGSNNATPTTPGAGNSHQYQQHYKQWTDYYSQTEVSCAPGTENMSVTSTSNPVCPAAAGYSATSTQPVVTYAPAWRPESGSSELPTVQPNTVTSNVHDNYWKQGAPTPSFQNYHASHPNYQKPLDPIPNYGGYQDQQKSEYLPPPPNFTYPPPPPPPTTISTTTTYQMPQNYHSSLPTAPQIVVPVESSQGVNKMQIPTNPRIASNLTFGSTNTGKDNSSTGGAATKPAYIGVSLPKQNDIVSSQSAADSILKPGMFPKSLRGYVERALARCKNDSQMTACQAVMKEVITKATADGTLYVRDWDTEPLFPMPQGDMVNNIGLQGSTTPISSLTKNRSPSRRSKSRWEPVAEVKPVEKPAFVIPNPLKHSFWGSNNNHRGREKQFSAGKSENKEDNLGNQKYSFSDSKSTNRNAPRPTKRQRPNDVLTDNGNESSDSDKEQSLTAYYSSAIALAESPDEIKKREGRSKRFEKARGSRGGSNNNNTHFKQRNDGAGNLYTRRATALVLSKNFEEGGGKRAVEDIDWDALTVKGTCMEIEKRYLRLTSAPDPATVRPEEVLEKALLMVQSSPKNYLYKCDQLKSIRQDLTVQRICNELTAKVYETHARLAIEVGDLSEYNQCQSQLTTLYAEGIKGCHMEFAAYNLLCVILHSSNNRDLLSAMSRLSIESRRDEAVKHALAVRAAVTSGNYVLFFRLYRTAPNLNTCLMDLYVEKMRYAAVKCMSRSYRPSLPVSYIAQVLGFATTTTEIGSDEKDNDGLEECVEWLKAHGACLKPDKNNSAEIMLDTKESASSLFMPEPDDAVAHGDASLAVNDFLTRTKTESA